MAFDTFLKVDGIDGESKDSKHDKWIDVISFSHGVSMPVTLTAGSLNAGKSTHQDFSVVKVVDKASPKLAEYCCAGQHIKEVKVELCRIIKEKQELFMQYKLTDVLVSSVRPGGSSQGGEALPLEEVSFTYGKIDWQYTQFDEKGANQGQVPASWNLKKNTK